jgi:asparagine synthase (glutamine-hydrolysing)
MCAIAGIISLDRTPLPDLGRRLEHMNACLAHRGPDGAGIYIDPAGLAGLAHRRLAIIDLSDAAAQPMTAETGSVIVHNGEIYNYPELRAQLSPEWTFRTRSDTESILAAHAHWGDGAVEHFRGMWAYAIWSPREQRLVASRDRFGIKPLYYMQTGGALYFASEIKALLPFMPRIDIDPDGMADYLTFQITLSGTTLVKGIRQLPPAHRLVVERGTIREERYWDVHYRIDPSLRAADWQARLRELFDDSIRLNLRSDAPLGAYLSGGIDSSLVAISASQAASRPLDFFHGKFSQPEGFDESASARVAAQAAGGHLHEIDMVAADFERTIADILFHLDEPVAGPGAFPQFLTARLAASKVKVALGGQGGDEIFGGYARYIIAYFEQCIKAAIDGTYKNGNFVVTIESIVPQLTMLHEYKPLLKTFWADGVFDDIDARYFRLINRAVDMKDEVDWQALPMQDVYERFRAAFNGRNVGKEAYFDKMTHFDFKHLLPGLLQVEDRMSMAHGLETRVPFLDHPLVEFAASVPADIKFSGGRAKQMLKEAFKDRVPAEILNRRDKMGFPVPLAHWFAGPLKTFAHDLLRSQGAGDLPYLNRDKIRLALDGNAPFSRKTWGLLSLELWRGHLARAAKDAYRP